MRRDFLVAFKAWVWLVAAGSLAVIPNPKPTVVRTFGIRGLLSSV